jgi:hypothetical protein
MEENHLFNLKIVNCDNCASKLEIMDQGGMDTDRYFYCTNCRNRAAISLYDPQWEIAERKVAASFPNATEDELYDLLSREFESSIASCECGGEFKYDAPRRCLHCSFPVNDAEPGRHIWPFVPEDGSWEEHEVAEELIEKYTIEAVWLEDRTD